MEEGTLFLIVLETINKGSSLCSRRNRYVVDISFDEFGVEEFVNELKNDSEKLSQYFSFEKELFVCVYVEEAEGRYSEQEFLIIPEITYPKSSKGGDHD